MHKIKYNQQSHGKPNTPLNFVRIKMLAQNAAPVRFTCFGRYTLFKHGELIVR